MANDPNNFIDLEGFADASGLPAKYFNAGDEYVGQAYVVVHENSVAVVADRKNLVAVDSDNGILLGGDISLSTMPDHLSFGGGYFRLNPLVLSTLPSTSPTPLPMLVRGTPKVLLGTEGMGDNLGALQSGLGI